MEEHTAGNLTARVSNCLQTILDLEPDLERLQMGHVLIKEFNVLKSFLSKVERIEIEEQDVRRIESATENFLRELKSPLALLELERIRNYLVQ